MSSITIEASTSSLVEISELSPASVTAGAYTELSAETADEPAVVAPTADPAIEAAINGYQMTARGGSSDTERRPGFEKADDVNPEITAEQLATELTHLLDSMAVVEELSRSARQAAATDLARYEAVLASVQQYRISFEQARDIRDQARDVLDRAFGHAARAAAEPLHSEAERVLAAFAQLVGAWNEQADGFLATHPDIEMLLAEQRAQEQERRELEAHVARQRRREALLAGIDAALSERVFAEVRRGLTGFEREFSEDEASLLSRQRRLDQLIRAEHDEVAKQAMLVATEQQANGDLEGAVGTLEQVDVRALSLEVSQDVFGRWCDACSRLAQTTGAQLVRYAPAQGRGLILLADPSQPEELQVFSSLGMGPNYPYGFVISTVIDEHEARTHEGLARARERVRFATTVLERARSFREATPAATTAWGFQTAAASASPIHH